jgi:glycosyltransferase involved in cell wall biosynthesis
MEVTVVVPARNASATLPATLAALSRQDFRGEFEVIVVDNVSDDDTADLARAAGATAVTMEVNRGPGPSRNAGARAGTGAVIAFTDADCEPAPDWLTAGVAALDRGADLVQGAVSPTPGVVFGPFDRTLEIRRWSGLFETANLLVRREAFERVDGFRPFLDEERDDGEPGLRPTLQEGPFGEDLWFGFRAQRAGARVAFAPDALVHHAVFPVTHAATSPSAGARATSPRSSGSRRSCATSCTTGSS